ncbi:MAG: ABC transporter permease, partial [Methanobacteriota archaeon]
NLSHVLSALNNLILPATTLALGTVDGVSLVMRNSLVDVMTEDYVVTARAKGIAERMILRRHVLPNGLPPMVTLIALDMAFIFGGAYQVEYVFSYEGIGWVTITAITQLDFPVIQFVVLLGGFAVVVANFLADLVLLKIDPRIKVT